MAKKSKNWENALYGTFFLARKTVDCNGAHFHYYWFLFRLESALHYIFSVPECDEAHFLHFQRSFYRRIVQSAVERICKIWSNILNNVRNCAPMHCFELKKPGVQ